MKQDMIVILDLGSEENPRLAREIRALGVYSEIYPHDITLAELNALPNVKGIILNGGPNHVVDGVEIDACSDIYGCGLHGINASESRFVVENSIIRDCSMHGAMLYSSRGIFTNCTFSGNCYQYTSNPVFDLWGESCSVNLNSCVIQDNLGESKYKLADGAEFEESDTIETGNSWQ